MDKTLEELMAQKAALEKQIEEVIKQKRQEAIAQAKKLVEDFQIRPEELFRNLGGAGTTKRSRAKASAKYRDPVSGKTWTGQGRAPRWFDKNNPDAFLIRA